MAAFKSVFGDQLLTKEGLKPTDAILGGKDGVLVYFSAHWCPPCRGFTPKLAEFHTTHSSSKNFQTVFVSGDRDQKSFDEYYEEMPWVSVPFDQSEIKTSLNKKFKVQGIPALVILGPEGELITKDGRSEVMSHFEDAAGFPWHPKSFKELLGSSFVKKDGATVGLEAIEGKTLGLYFSAHWCPPCRGFTPKLKEFYTELKDKDPNFEIIFVSSDKDEAGMTSYFREDHGDYLALPFSNREAKDGLSKLFGVEGIPTFSVVDSSGKVLNANARGKVGAGADAVLKDGWAPPAVGDLAEGPEAAGTDINETPTLIVVCDKSSDEQKSSMLSEMTPVAKKYIEEAERTGEDIKYIFLQAKDAGPLQQLRALTKKDAEAEMAVECPVMVLFDIPDNGGFYVRAAESGVTQACIEQFIADKEGGKVTRKQLGQ